MDPEIPRSSEPGLGRLLRRRARAKRLSRSYQGKAFKSWAEYAPKMLQTTGDHSPGGQWAYVAIFCGAILIVPLIIGLLNLSSPLMDSQPLAWRVVWLFKFLFPFLVIAAALPLAAFFHGCWRVRRLRRKL